MTTQWVRTFENGAEYVESLGGVMWNKAPLPLPWHRCHPQSRGWLGQNYVERCACGASRLSAGDPWIERNQTRRGRARARREARLPRVQVACRECGRSYEAAAGTPVAEQRLCNNCWTAAFTASGGRRY